MGGREGDFEGLRVTPEGDWVGLVTGTDVGAAVGFSVGRVGDLVGCKEGCGVGKVG